MQRIANLPNPGRTTIEGPFAFKRNGTYYLTYPHAVTVNGQQGAEQLEYAISTNAMGPYNWVGIITDTNASGCWTEHHSIVQYKGQWYLFYHDKQLSPNFDKNRSVRIDRLYFNDDGTIKKVIPTLRGVGIVDAKSKIQIDRYSDISKAGVAAAFINTNNTFEGWKISLHGKNTWVQFNDVDFGKGGLRKVNVRSASSAGGSIEIRLDKVDGPLLAGVEIGKSPEWQVKTSAMTGIRRSERSGAPLKGATLLMQSSSSLNMPAGIHNLVVTHDEDNQVDLDWISFE
jgi:hypothetical protein